VVTGDVTQTDLPEGRQSGLVEARGILQEIEGIQFVFFSKADVVRHRLVQDIIEAYERLETRKSIQAERAETAEKGESGTLTPKPPV
jgi:phosphate starvation-inducible PhoH-like protein